MIGSVGKAMQAMFAADLESARASEGRADRAKEAQFEKQSVEAEARYDKGLEEIEKAKEEAIIAGVGAAISVATSLVGCVGAVPAAVQTGVKLAGAAAEGAKAPVTEAFTHDNSVAITELGHDADVANIYRTRLEGQADEARSDASDAKSRARDNFRAALEATQGLGAARRLDGGQS